MSPSVGLRKRVILLFFGTTLAILLLAGRLAYLQLIRGDELRVEALENRLREVQVQPKRGAIVDRNGHELAISVSADSVYAVPGEIGDPDYVAKVLSEELGIPYTDVYQRVTRDLSFVWIQRKVPDQVALRLRQLNLPGIYFTQESRRLYPKGELAAHVLGISGIDSQGLEGVELVFDEELRGIYGTIKVEFDARSREIPQATQQYTPPVDGSVLQLTIDENIQYIAERELDRAMMAHQAKAGYVIVMDPRTGEVLAMAIRPTFDPNNFADYPAEVRRNRAVSDVLPPGSSFKPITAAAAIEEGTIRPETPFYDPGYFKVPGHTIRNWNYQGLGSTTFAEGFQESSNTIFASVALNNLGTEKFYRYLHAFGLVDKTGIDLPGEARGLQPPQSSARPVDIAVMGFGQTLTVTPIQMITAIAAIANDGMLMRPRVAKAIISPDGKLIKEFRPEPVRQVVSPETARTVRQLMKLVVEEGTGTRAQIEGYAVGGKTGTSQKVIDGRLVPGHYLASFIGIAPIDDPRVVVYVVIDEPQGIYYGGWVAAPIFAQVTRDVLHYLEVEPDYTGEIGTPAPLGEPTLVPDVINLPVEEAEQVLRYAGLTAEIRGEGIVTDQFPGPGVRVLAGSRVVLTTSDTPGDAQDPEKAAPVPVPDVSGMSRSQVAAELSRVGLRLDAQGDGYAVSQMPAAGEEVPSGSFVRVLFEPLGPAPETTPDGEEAGTASGP